MKLFNKTIWAITPEMLQTMMSLAKENNKPPEAIAREMGKEMKDSNAASVRDGVCVNSLQTTPILMGVECARRRCYKKVWKLYKVSIVFTD